MTVYVFGLSSSIGWSNREVKPMFGNIFCVVLCTPAQWSGLNGCPSPCIGIILLFTPHLGAPHLRFYMVMLLVTLVFHPKQWLLTWSWRIGWRKGSWWLGSLSYIWLMHMIEWRSMLINMDERGISLWVTRCIWNCNHTFSPWWLHVPIKNWHSNSLDLTKSWLKWDQWLIACNCLLLVLSIRSYMFLN